MTVQDVEGSSFIRERLRRGYPSGGYDEPLTRNQPQVPTLYSAPQQSGYSRPLQPQPIQAQSPSPLYQRPMEQNEIQGTTTEVNSYEDSPSSQQPEEGVSEEYQFGSATQSPSGGGSPSDTTGPSFFNNESSSEDSSSSDSAEDLRRKQIPTTTFKSAGGYGYESSNGIDNKGYPDSKAESSSPPINPSINEISQSYFRRPLDQQQVENSQYPFQATVSFPSY